MIPGRKSQETFAQRFQPAVGLMTMFLSLNDSGDTQLVLLGSGSVLLAD